MSLTDVITSRTRRRLADTAHRGWQWIQTVAQVTPHTRLGQRFGHFGAGSCMVFPFGTVFGEPWIHVGENTALGQHCSLSAGLVPGLELGPDPIVRIGDNCKIARGSHIVGHHSLEIGDYVITGPYVYITDQNHTYDDPELPIDWQWPTEKPVRIGSGSWLGAGVVVLPGAVLGKHVVVAAGSVVRGEFPDYCVIAGAPARVVRRYVPGEGWQRPAPELHLD